MSLIYAWICEQLNNVYIGGAATNNLRKARYIWQWLYVVHWRLNWSEGLMSRTDSFTFWCCAGAVSTDRCIVAPNYQCRHVLVTPAETTEHRINRQFMSIVKYGRSVCLSPADNQGSANFKRSQKDMPELQWWTSLHILAKRTNFCTEMSRTWCLYVRSYIGPVGLSAWD
jgi:hypothetical protein